MCFRPEKSQATNLPCIVCFYPFILSHEIHCPIFIATATVAWGLCGLCCLHSPALPAPSGAQVTKSSSSFWLGLQPAGPQWWGTSGLRHTALIQVCTQLDCFSCSRSVVIILSTSGHGPVTRQAGIQPACTRGLHLLCLPTFSPLGYMTIMLIFLERWGFKVGEDSHRESRWQRVNNTWVREAPAVLKHFQM